MTSKKLSTPISVAVAAVAGFAAASVALANTSHEVGQKGKAFSEDSLEIAAGDKVVFMNDDKSKHNIIVKDLKFNSGLVKPGDQTEVEFAKAGEYKVRCGIHPKMKMMVVVK